MPSLPLRGRYATFCHPICQLVAMGFHFLVIVSHASRNICVLVLTLRCVPDENAKERKCKLISEPWVFQGAHSLYIPTSTVWFFHSFLTVIFILHYYSSILVGAKWHLFVVWFSFLPRLMALSIYSCTVGHSFIFSKKKKKSDKFYVKVWVCSLVVDCLACLGP